MIPHCFGGQYAGLSDLHHMAYQCLDTIVQRLEFLALPELEQLRALQLFTAAFSQLGVG